MADTVHVLSAQRLTPAQLDQLRAVSPRLVVEQRPAFTAAAVQEALTPETEILLTGRTDFAPEHAPALRWVQLTNAGVNSAHGSALWNSPISITNASGIHAGHLSQYTLAVMLAHAHHLPLAQRLQARRAWPHKEKERILTPWELRGRTVGILGYGAIGRELGRLAQALGMRVLATKRAEASPRFDGWTPAGTGDPDGTIPERYYTLEELPDLLAASDVVVLALPLVQATLHVIGAAELAAMRPDALLVNIGRGPLIDQNALIAALEAGKLGGAALDVTDPEPLPADSPLWGFENVQITPHISGMSANYDALTADLFAENLRRYLAGDPLLNLVDRERGY
jgi:phosphoglycerate dehydrogenase-like enzyme